MTLGWFLLGGLCGALASLYGARVAIRGSVRRAVSAERRATDAERLAEIGSMTGGLAHEIKNPLSTIGLNAQRWARRSRTSRSTRANAPRSRSAPRC